MVEGSRVEGQGKDVGLAELNVGEPRLPHARAGFGDGLGRDVDREEAGAGAAPGQGQGLGTDAAARLEHRAPGRIRGVGVEQLDKGTCLVMQALVLARVVAVDVALAHAPRSDRDSAVRRGA